MAGTHGGRVTAPPETLAVDPGLLSRFRAAGEAIAWRPSPAPPRRKGGPRVRIAHLYEEEARVETWNTADGVALRADSGPVGALVVLLEIARQGPPHRLVSQNAGRADGFAAGAIVAVWGTLENPPADSTLEPTDLVELARYALR
jgi:hypothetical protein